MLTVIHRGAVASGHPSTTEAGLFALERGGNAVDAVVAAALAASVCEALLSGLGGGGLITIRDGRDGSVTVLDAFSSFPGKDGGLNAGDFEAIRIDYGPLDQAFHVGRGSVAVPGAAPGLALAHQRFCRLPLSVLAEPAAALARDGWMVTPTTAVVSRSLAAIISRSARGSALYLPGGQPLAAGMMVRSPAQARAMEDFGAEGAEAFTRGRHGQSFVSAFGRPGGSVGLEDLMGFQPTTRPPLRVSYRGSLLHLPGPPCVGGPLVAFGLELLTRLDPSNDAGERALVLALVMEATEAARRTHLQDPFLSGAVDRLLEVGHLDRVAEQIDDRKRRRSEAPGPASGAPGPALGNTTHVSCVDADGFAASWTSSNGETCGELWPGLDLPVNNFLGEADLHPSGFHRGRPGDSLMTMMTPSIMETGDGRMVVLGTGGANRIRTTMLQTIDALARGQDLDGAVDRPRLHVEGGVASIERAGAQPGVEAAMGSIGLAVKTFEENHLYFGGVHAVSRGPRGFETKGDPRRSGTGGTR